MQWFRVLVAMLALTLWGHHLLQLDVTSDFEYFSLEEGRGIITN